MGVLIFPLLSTVLLGQCFDLVKFNMVYVNPYTNTNLRNYTTKTAINSFTSEFSLVDSSGKLAKFVGMNVVSYLKREYDLWQYGPTKAALSIVPTDRFKKLTIAVKMSLKTVNETIRENTPVDEDLESRQADYGGSHYLKTIIYGAEIHSIFDIYAKNKTHFRQIKKALRSETGFKGTFDEHFKEKLERVVQSTNTRYGVPSNAMYGIEFDYYHSVSKLLQLKNNLEGNRSLVHDNVRVAFEFHSLSEISSIPPVEIKSKIMKQVLRLQLINDDVKIASNELKNFLISGKTSLHDMKKTVSNLLSFLRSLQGEIENAVINMDISRSGDIHQFDNVFAKYNSTDTKKFKTIVGNLIKPNK